MMRCIRGKFKLLSIHKSNEKLKKFCVAGFGVKSILVAE